MSRSEPQLNFRCPPELRERLEAAAGVSKRSLTGEIIARLQSTFEPEQKQLDLGIGPLADAIAEVRRDLKSQRAYIEKMVAQGWKMEVSETGGIKGSRTFPGTLFGGAGDEGEKVSIEAAAPAKKPRAKR